MTVHRNDTKHVCHVCIGDQFLAEEVKELGSPTQCSYCDETREGVTLDVLAGRIGETVDEHFVLTPMEPSAYDSVMMREGLSGYWVRDGYPVDELIGSIAGVSEEIASDVSRLLSDHHSYEAAKDGEEDPYGFEAHYEEREAFDLWFRMNWVELQRELRSRSRFLNSDAEVMLTDIFGDLAIHRTYDDKPVIVDIDPDAEDRFIWRARVALSELEIETILENPAKGIGPPPSKWANAGRMNARGISVFYGAMERATCVAEVRAPVGSHVVIGKFEVVRPVRLLDLDALAEVSVDGSYFDSTYSEQRSRAAFLRDFRNEISQPVMPNDEDQEYLATQFVAEYLANKVAPRIDGMIFPSTQTGGHGRNVVLFHHASGLEPYELPQGSNVDVNFDALRYGGQILVWERVPHESENKPSPINKKTRPTLRGFFEYLTLEQDESLPPTLRLDLGSVEVLDIKGVKFEFNLRMVSRRRTVAPPPGSTQC